MPRGNYRRPYQAPFDPTITQKIKNALFEAGREDLVDALRDSGMAELEEELHKAKERIHALELEKKNWLTESGMFRALDRRAGKVAVSWGKRALQAAAGAVGIGAISAIVWVAKLAWKGYTHK
jgi:hypothetical protein